MKFASKKFNELTAAELYEIMRARNEIFVIEQNCIYQDCDDCDYGYHVYYADDSGKVLAYMRIYEIHEEDAVVSFDGREIWCNNLTPQQLEKSSHVCGGPCQVPTVQMGRVLTIKHGEGLGGRLLKEGIKVAWEKMNAERVFIEAESDVIGYYEKAGFKSISGEFSKDEIPHVQMELYRQAIEPV